MSMESSSPDQLVILIVEDEEPIALALSLVIEDAGFSAVWAPDGRTALVLVRERRPALIITDYMMPRMSGAQFVEALRIQEEAAGRALPPIIMMSATDMQYTKDLPAVARIAKPFDINKIEDLLRRHAVPAST